MMELLLLGIGGALGSLTRFQFGTIISKKAITSFPYGTFIINITGALLLGIVSGLNIQGNLYLLLADAFLGAYTTFSTFMYEGVNLFQNNEKKNAVYYILGTLLIGIIGFVAGFLLGRLI